MRTKYRPPEGVLAASFKGVVQIINKKDGSTIARAWQPKEGPPKTAINKLNTSTFSTVVKMIKNAVDLDVIGAVEITKGTSLLPRDVLMMGATGTIFQFRFPDGTYIQGGPQLSQSIQALLDSISNAPGTILGRTAVGWQALVPAQAGWYLMSQGESNPPLWSPVPGQSGGFAGLFTQRAGEYVLSVSDPPNYPNNTGRLMIVKIVTIGLNDYDAIALTTFFADGTQASYDAFSRPQIPYFQTVTGYVPVGGYYQATISGGTSWEVDTWTEIS